jgi:hypothetical protein
LRAARIASSAGIEHLGRDVDEQLYDLAAWETAAAAALL